MFDMNVYAHLGMLNAQMLSVSHFTGNATLNGEVNCLM
jgi:hypothetical protein